MNLKVFALATLLMGVVCSVSSQSVKTMNTVSSPSKPSEPREAKTVSPNFVVLRAVLASDGSFLRVEPTEKEISAVKESMENKDGNYQASKLAYEAMMEAEFDLGKTLNAYGALGYELEGIVQPTAEMNPKVVTFILHKD